MTTDSEVGEEEVNYPIKTEPPVETLEQGYSSLVALAGMLDADVLLQAVGPKIFDRFTIWDLMVEKVKSTERCSEFGALPLLIDDTERILLELRNVMELCMDYQPAKSMERKVTVDRGEFYVTDMVGTALCLETGIWRQKDDLEAAKREVPIDFSTLLPDKPPATRTPSTLMGKIKKKPGRKPKNRDPDAPQTTPKKRKMKKEDGITDDEGVADSEEMESLKAQKKRKTMLKFTKKEKKFLCKFPDCPEADQAFPNRAVFEQHFLVQHMKAEDRVIPCSIEDCPEMFALTSEKNQHMLESHQKTIPCPHCKKMFFGKKECQDHVSRYHTESGAPKLNKTQEEMDPTCVCTRCGKRFTSQKAVDSHEKNCDGLFVRQPKFTRSKVDQMYFCQEVDCPNKTAFESEYSLRMHFYDNHLREAEKIFVCEHCQARFALRTILNKHIKLVHDKKHVCDHCGRKFGAKDKLKQHVYTHTGEKPYACDKCDYRTAKKYNLDQHKQSKHQDFGIKSHYCELCGKGFVTQGRVRQHKKVIHKEGRVVKARNRGGGPGAAVKKVATTATTVHVQHQQHHLHPQQQQQQQQHMGVTEEQEAAVEYITTDLSDQTGVIVGLRY